MRRRSLFDAPTNCNAQQLARLRVSVKANRDWLTVQPIILPPPPSCICCGVELEETRRGQYCGAVCEYALTLIQPSDAGPVRPATYLWVVDVEVSPNGGGMSVAVGLVLTPNPRSTHVMALDELDHPMKKRISAETWDQAQALKQAWLEHPYR